MATAKSVKTAEHHDPRVDAQINKAPAFAKPILEYLRAAVHEAVPQVTEEIKWGRPFFVLNEQIFGNMSAFSKHCSFGFWSANMTKLLEADGIDGSGSAGSLGKITSLDDLPPRKVLIGYLKTAAKMVKDGTYGPGLMGDNTKKSVKAPLPVPPDFSNALAKSRSAKANFEAFPPSSRREYIEWISTAKRPETREKRIAEAVAKIAEGKRHNDQYRAT